MTQKEKIEKVSNLLLQKLGTREETLSKEAINRINITLFLYSCGRLEPLEALLKITVTASREMALAVSDIDDLFTK